MFPITIRTSDKIFGQYSGFSFFIFIWIYRQEQDIARLIRHEKIHFYQQLELLFVGHWLLYGYFYLISRYKRHRHYIAYRYNPFEIEAYDHERQENYLAERKPFSWIKYIVRHREALAGDSVMKSKK